jgi:hypothetical protein
MNLSDRDLEILSAYLDGEISRKDRERLEARLLEEEVLQNTLDELQRTRQVIRSLPAIRAPRNYYLTPEMVGRKEPVSRAFPVLRFASVLASVLFVLLFLGDILVPRTGVVSNLKAVQVVETVIEEAEAPQMEIEPPEAEELPIAEGEAAESPVSEAPLIESELPEAMVDPSEEMAPAEADAAAPLPEATPILPPEPAAGLERMMATGIPSPMEDSGEVGELAESFSTPSLLDEGGEIDIPLEDEVRPILDIWMIVRYFEIFLILVALTTGLAALFLFRRNKFIP